VNYISHANGQTLDVEGDEEEEGEEEEEWVEEEEVEEESDEVRDLLSTHSDWLRM